VRICVYGAGVIGGILASAIAQAGHDVCLIARGPHLEAIKAKGLTVRTPTVERTMRTPASDNPADFGPQDLVVAATKTPAFAQIARDIGPLLGRDTLVAFAVNGVFWFYGDGFSPRGKPIDLRRLDRDGSLHEKIGVERALGLVCWGGGEIRTPGLVETTGPGGRFVVGAALPSAQDRSQRLAEALGVKDISLRATTEIRWAMWSKLLGVLSNFAICTLTGGTIADTRSDAEVFETILGLMAETNAVAQAHGFDNLDFDPVKLRAERGGSRHKPSMLQDFERGRAMEIETTFGAVQDLARQSGVSTPILDVVAPLVALKARLAGCA
jgi:2-dehydropantoate 2-reductase